MPTRTSYTHRGAKHAKRLRHCNERRAAAGMMPVGTITQFEKELKTLQAKERELREAPAKAEMKRHEELAADALPQA